MSCPCAMARLPEKDTCSTSSTSLATLPSRSMRSWPCFDGEAGAGGEETGKHDFPRPRGDVDKAAGARRHMRTRAELGDVDGALPVDLKEGQQRAIEAGALEVGELIGRGHDRLGIGRAAELEVEQRHAADRSLFDHPGDGAMLAFFDQDARHIGGNAKADIDGVAIAQLLRDAARDDFGDVEFRQFEC